MPIRACPDSDFVIHWNAHMDMCLCYQVSVSCILQLMTTLLCVEKHVWACAFVTKSMSSASWGSWRLCYMSKLMYEYVLVLPSQRLLRPAADDDFVWVWLTILWGWLLKTFTFNTCCTLQGHTYLNKTPAESCRFVWVCMTLLWTPDVKG